MRPVPLVAALLFGRALTCAVTPLAAQPLRAGGTDERGAGELRLRGVGASRGMAIRISWSDNTRYFWREPGDIWLARETSFVSQVF